MYYTFWCYVPRFGPVYVLGLYSLSGTRRTFYCNISWWSLDAARFGFRFFNHSKISQALRQQRRDDDYSMLRDFARFGGKTPYRLVIRGPGLAFEEIENDLCTRVTNCFGAHERVIYKYQNNTRVSAETVHHESTYIILFLTRHTESINDKNDDLSASPQCLTRSVFDLLMVSQFIDDDVTMTRQLWPDHVNSDIYRVI